MKLKNPSAKFSFNTQPPEGGCGNVQHIILVVHQFQHTATRRWLRRQLGRAWRAGLVSTHSHPKVAAAMNAIGAGVSDVSTHSHPKVAAVYGEFTWHIKRVSTHSHPKVAAASSA